MLQQQQQECDDELHMESTERRIGIRCLGWIGGYLVGKMVGSLSTEAKARAGLMDRHRSVESSGASHHDVKGTQGTSSQVVNRKY